MQLVVVFLLGLFIFLAMKGLRIGLRRLARVYPGWNFRFNLLAAIEFTIWLSYIFWAANHLFSDKFFYQYLVYSLYFITFVLLTWFLIADIVAGVVFKVKYNLRPGMNIRTKDFSGTIKSQHVTYIKLRTEEGQIVRVPYNKINNLVISEMIHPEWLAEHVIHVRIAPGLSKQDAGKLIRETIINMPWSNLKEEPSIKFIRETENGFFVDVILFSTSLEHKKFIELAIDNNPLLKVTT